MFIFVKQYKSTLYYIHSDIVNAKFKIQAKSKQSKIERDEKKMKETGI